MITRRKFLAGLSGMAAGALATPLRAAEPKKDPEPHWTNVPALRHTDPRRLGVVLADVDSRLPARGQISSATYHDPDRLTWAHEATHGVNSYTRNHYAPNGHQYNAAYVLGGRAAVIEEPRPVTLQEVARYVPIGLRGRSTYSKHMIQAAKHWNDRPLYVLDEWAAYTNGAAQFVNELKAGIPQDSISDLLYVAHFSVYSLCLAVAVDQSRRKGRMRYDDTQLRLFVAWQWDRVMQLFADASPYKGFWDPISYYRKFAVEPVGADLRRWARGYFGQAWVSAVMRAASEQQNASAATV